MPAWFENVLELWRHEASGLRDAAGGQFSELLEGVLVYSFAVSIVWSVSGLVSWMRQRRAERQTAAAAVSDYTVLIPFHGEYRGALKTAWSLANVTPRPHQIVLVDDGSPEPVDESLALPPDTRVLRLDKRRGKAGALKEALPSVSTEIVVCLDADTQSRVNDWRGMLSKFSDPELGAVTGRIWAASNGSFVGRLQEIDYLAVISVIKAAESLWGGLLTVSGAFVAFRTSALRGIGGWDTDKAAEDIDISWRLQMAGWRLEFDSRWTCAVEMAPTVPALWRQRRRWSAGLGQALYDYGIRAFVSGARHLPVIVVTLANTIWITLMLAFAAAAIWQMLTGATWLTGVLQHLDVHRAILAGLGLFLVQFLVATLIDGRSWSVYWRLLPYLPLYPIYFWSILCTSFLFGFSRGIVRRKLGVWQPTVRAPDFRKT